MKTEILAYFCVYILSIIVITVNYSQFRIANNDDLMVKRNCMKKIHPITILAVALIWVCFNWFITSLHPVMGNDWVNYTANFEGTRETPSIGLAFLIKLVHWMGGDMYDLSRLSTFICLTITLIAYRVSRNATPTSLAFLLLTQYAYLSISLLKQSFTNVIATLFIVLVIEYNDKKSTIISIVLIVAAILFHPTGFLLIPLFVVLKIGHNKKSLITYTIVMILFALFFEPFMIVLGRVMTPIIPSLGNKILQYFNENTIQDQSASLTVFKSIGEVIIVLLGVLKRKHLSTIVKDYDKYLITAITGVFFYLMSVYNVWLYRMIYLFYFALFVFLDTILQNLKIKTNKQIITVVLVAIFGFILYRFLYISFP